MLPPALDLQLSVSCILYWTIIWQRIFTISDFRQRRNEKTLLFACFAGHGAQGCCTPALSKIVFLTQVDVYHGYILLWFRFYVSGLVLGFWALGLVFSEVLGCQGLRLN
jgi:hypothetical protein